MASAASKQRDISIAANICGSRVYFSTDTSLFAFERVTSSDSPLHEAKHSSSASCFANYRPTANENVAGRKLSETFPPPEPAKRFHVFLCRFRRCPIKILDGAASVERKFAPRRSLLRQDPRKKQKIGEKFSWQVIGNETLSSNSLLRADRRDVGWPIFAYRREMYIWRRCDDGGVYMETGLDASRNLHSEYFHDRRRESWKEPIAFFWDPRPPLWIPALEDAPCAFALRFAYGARHLSGTESVEQ